ncbi:MAG TPA: sensor histidine kinase [Parasegetibacter sp.]
MFLTLDKLMAAPSAGWNIIISRINLWAFLVVLIFAEIPVYSQTSNSDTLLQKGIDLYNSGQYEKAIEHFELSLSGAQQKNDRYSLAAIYNNLGNAYSQTGKIVQALENYQKSVLIAEEIKDTTRLARVLNNMGALHESLKDFPQALAHYNRAEDLARTRKDSSILADCANNKGIIFEQQQKYKEALAAYSTALKIYEKKGLTDRIALTLNNIGIVHKFLGNYSEAIASYNRSAALAEEIGDQYFVAANYINMGNVYRLQNQMAKAVNLHQKALELGKEISAANIIFESYGSLAEDYAVSGNFKKAYELHRKYKEVTDSFINEERTRQLAEMQTRFETAQKEQQIDLLSKENTIHKLTISRRNNIILFIAGAFILTVLLGFLFYNRYKLQQRAKLQQAIIKQQDLATKAIIEAEENERKRIASDLHDGVGQMMSAVRMNLSAMEQHLTFRSDEQRAKYEKVVALVDESCREVRAVSHNMMPNALLKSGLASAVREFIEKIDHSVLKVDLYSEGLNERIDSNIETVLYRVIQECVNNVIKHSGANHLDISLVRDEHGISATIEDNGKGFDITDAGKFEGIGMKNIRSRVEYLKGTVEFDSRPGNGTLIAIHVPIK